MSAAPSATAAEPRPLPWINLQASAPVVLFLLTLAIYLATLTSVHTFDALSYVTSVERKPWTEVFHPHHLAYGPLGVAALHLGQILGYTGGAALPMQVLNAFAGSLGVALFWRLVRRVTGRGDVALAATLLLGGAYAYWYYAVEIEVYTVAAVFLIVCLDLLAQPGIWTTRRVLALAGAQAGAILFHQTNVLLCAPIAICALADLRGLAPLTPGPSPTPGRGESSLRSATSQSGEMSLAWLRRWGLYALALALAVVVPYVIVGVGISGFKSWVAFDNWLTEYARTGWW